MLTMHPTIMMLTIAWIGLLMAVLQYKAICFSFSFENYLWLETWNCKFSIPHLIFFLIFYGDLNLWISISFNVTLYIVTTISCWCSNIPKLKEAFVLFKHVCSVLEECLIFWHPADAFVFVLLISEISEEVNIKSK